MVIKKCKENEKDDNDYKEFCEKLYQFLNNEKKLRE